jgi:hypothetical protein
MSILSRILVTRQEINGFRIKWSCLLDNSFKIRIKIALKERFPDDATWLVRRLLVLGWAGFFCSHLSSVRLWSGLRSGLLWSDLFSESESYITTDDQSASLSYNKAPIRGLRPDFYYYQAIACLLVCGALSDERTGLSLTIEAGPRQRSRSRVRVPWD